MFFQRFFNVQKTAKSFLYLCINSPLSFLSNQNDLKGQPVVKENFKRCVLLLYHLQFFVPLHIFLYITFSLLAIFSFVYTRTLYQCISYFNNKTRGHYFLDFMKFNGLQSFMYKLKRINYSLIIMVITVHICKQQLNDFKVFEIPTSCTCP